MCCECAYVKEKLNGIFIFLLRQSQGPVTLYISLVPLFVGISLMEATWHAAAFCPAF